MSPRAVVLAVLVAAMSVTVHTQGKSPVEGVWRVAEVQVTGGDNPGTNKSPQPSLYIYTRGHYSVMAINGDKPRTTIPFQQAPATDAQKMALYEHWAGFTANSGTYTIKGSTLTTRPLVAKNEGVMQAPAQEREFKVEGSTLWLIQKPAGAPGVEIRTRLTRVE